MNRQQINNIHRNTLKLVYSGKLHEAVSIIKSQDVFKTGDSSSPLSVVEDTYKLMLKYTIDGMQDPSRGEIFRQLQVSLMMMADSVRNAQYKRYAPSEIFCHGYKDMPAQPIDNDSSVIPWFHYVLRAESLDAAAEQALAAACSGNDISWISKCLVASCLMLSCLLYFDIRKYRLLAGLYLGGQQQVWQRAIVGIAVVSYYFNKRLRMYPESKAIIASLMDSPKFPSRYQATIFQLIRAIDTDRLSKRINEEILPQVANIPGIKRKMLSDSFTIDSMDDKNPIWRDVEDNKALLDKLADMSKIQMEGGDLFISTFAQLKNYDFFRKIENWFMPFTKSAKAVADLIAGSGTRKGKIAAMAEALQQTPFVCNSDKYSLCLSLAVMPESQMGSLGGCLGGSLSQIAEDTKESQLLHGEEFSLKYLVQYIQDIYRFFKINILGKDFIDIFGKGFSPSGTMLFDAAFSSPKQKRKVGEFFFASEYYRQAFDIFKSISAEAPDFEIFQKMGYSAQKAGDIEAALDSYLKAQLYDSEQPWNLKRIGWCCRKLKKPSMALEYYQKADQIEPGNLSTAQAIGRCLLEMESYSEALKYYFKVEFLDEGNTKVCRPIAWCCYESGKLEQSLKYCQRIPPADIIPEDMVLAGHACRMMGNIKEAVEYYRKAIGMQGYDMKKLEEAIVSDYKPAGAVNLEQENNLLLDYISYCLE